MKFIDQLHRTIVIQKTPERIVSLVPSQTELLVDLGLESSLVGVTKFCVHPKHLRISKKVIGGTKKINVEKIKELQPDIILCNKEENTKDIIEALKEIAPIHISDVSNIHDCFELIRMYGELFKIEKAASSIVASIEEKRINFQKKVETIKKQKVAYFIWKDPWMVVASGTFIDSMLREVSFENSFESENRYPEINLTDERLKDTDIILLSSEPFPFSEKHVLELKSKFPRKVIKIVDGELFSWYGSRLLKSYTYFSKIIGYK
ncbi:ABC transporter substrate-binding protein [Winogradskyella sp. PE311]|uniref:ABC transporter substrate-binding protein n=1 Tax=Winogradskyella sp. PE311 TaxID=3366943 RepID=UPI0039803095